MAEGSGVQYLPVSSVIYQDVTSANGNAGGTTLICGDLIGSVDFLTQKIVMLPLGNRYISAFDPSTGTITIAPAYPIQILANTKVTIIGGGGGGGGVWLAQIPQTLYNALPPGVGTYNSTWFNATNQKRGSFDIVSTIDQMIVLQLVGNQTQSFATAKNINAPRTLGAGNASPTGTDYGWGTNDDWHAYFALTITTALAPAVGSVIIIATSQA